MTPAAVLLPMGLRPKTKEPPFQPGAHRAEISQLHKSKDGELSADFAEQVEEPMREYTKKTRKRSTQDAGLAYAAMLPDERNPLKALQRLRQNPDSTEFVYLRPFYVDESTPLNPYHLEIVQHHDIDEKNFFTLSSFGVTQMLNGSPEFTELEQWKREHYLFNAISKIPVFRMYRTWKSYKVWRDSVRYGKMKKSAKALQKNLFWMNPTFQAALLQIKSMCMELKKLQLLKFSPGVLYTLEQFYESQKAQRNMITQELQEFWVHAVDVVRAACHDTLESLEEDLFGGRGGADAGVETDKEQNRAENFRYTGWPLSCYPALCGGPDLDVPSSPILSNVCFICAVMASKRVAQKRIYFFLRLCDYVIFNTLHSMVVESVTELLDELNMASQASQAAEESVRERGLETVDEKKDSKKKKEEAKSSVFVTEVMLVLGDLTFVPAASDFENELESIVGGFVDTVAGDESARLLNNEELEQFTELYESESEEASTVADIISNDEEYMRLNDGLRDAIASAFGACDAYMASFEPFRDMVAENSTLTSDDLWEGAQNGDIVLEDFKTKLETYSTQAEDILNLPDAKECGIIEVNAEKLKQMIAPSPASCLEKLEVLLPQLAIIKQKKLLDEVNEANEKLNRPPQSVAEFVDLLDFIAAVEDRKDDLEDEFVELSNHYKLMDSHGVKVTRSFDTPFWRLPSLLCRHRCSFC